ncbi:helix-turn-helix domain-containing protein [Heyndrickxia acidicola]|uniref:Helix-turn-helix transcriptional regulator n=1 Tax=Heyndrickxia acidicola TaxID=209389 RepID=A0ABU6MJX2_9BACI|nr:helix-turn-helix transcriptional regulator [Heyndrickxia acidicola]MED1204985.1 helix-turn-helix transcriptional regulator [Heyndrickxia acidicola]
MNIGTRIHFYRLKKRMTEAELAEGITTVAYLKSIEKNEQTPPIELMSGLCDKLEIPFMTNVNETLIELLERWRRYLVLNHKEKADELHQSILKSISDQDEFKLILTYHTYLIRYHLIHSNLEEALELIEQLKPFQFDLPDELKFAFHKCCGNYFYYHQKYTKAVQAFSHAKKYLISIRSHLKEEQADLYYMYGLVLSRMRKNTLTIYYIEEALSLFQGTYQFKRCTDCHLLLGLAYRRVQDYFESAKHYNWARELAESTGYMSILPKIDNNLGILKSQEGNSSQAISFFLRSLEHPSDPKRPKRQDTLNTILNIIKEYYIIGCFEQVNKWLDEGFRHVLDHEDYKQQMIELKFYKYIADGFPSGFDVFVLEEAIPYFKEIKKYHLLILYSKTLGDYYNNRELYKEAAASFALANSAYEKILAL